MIPHSSMYYGDDTRWFVATVVSISDPNKLGRVKVRIRGIHSDSIDDIPERDLPWAQVVLPPTEGGSSGIGSTVGIKPGAQVFGIFLDGKNSQLPLVVGSIAKVEGEKSSVGLTGQSNVEKAFNFFISIRGGEFTPEQACGMIGNFLKESGTAGDINPTALNKTEGSFGIAQWNPQFDESSPTGRKPGNRYDDLLHFCSERGLNFQELEPQLEFVKFELYNVAWTGLEQLRAAESVKEATVAFQNKYERPNAAAAGTADRIRFAENTLQEMEK